MYCFIWLYIKQLSACIEQLLIYCAALLLKYIYVGYLGFLDILTQIIHKYEDALLKANNYIFKAIYKLLWIFHIHVSKCY